MKAKNEKANENEKATANCLKIGIEEKDGQHGTPLVDTVKVSSPFMRTLKKNVQQSEKKKTTKMRTKKAG